MTRIACLHTAEGNVALFDAALRASGTAGVDLDHHLRPDLLADAERAGGLTPEIAARTEGALRALCPGADAVLLTCSTLGPAAEAAAAGAPVPILRVDAALAAAAAAGGGRVVALCAVETTVAPTRAVFEAAAQAAGAAVEVRLVPGAWAAFRAGDADGYAALVAEAAEGALREGAARVALAQASMSGAAALAPAGRRPLDSPTIGLSAAIRAARGA